MPNWAAWPFPTDDPYAAYDAAREHAPVQWNEALGAHLILSHDAAASVLRDAGWSSDPRNNPQALAALGGPGAMADLWSSSLLQSDPPTHTRLRRAVNRFFTPHAVQRIGDRVSAIVDSALAPLLDGEPIELMSELAYPIPLAVIAELFDVGLEGAELLRSQTPQLAKLLELDATQPDLQRSGEASMNLMLLLVPLLARRQSEPGDDLLSALIHPPDGGVELATEEIVTMCLLLLAAGHETTANLIGNGTLALLQHPQQLHALRQRPDLIAQAVDELLRYDSPVQIASRIATVDHTLHGVQVHAGEQALIVLGAANRDSQRYAQPHRLDFTRTAGHSLAFGLGPHFCIGAGLARLEAQHTFARIAQSPWNPAPGTWKARRDSARTFRRLSELRIDATPTRPLQSQSASLLR